MWREISRAFGELAEEYDAWYQENPLFEAELAALKELGSPPQPALEIGVGTGVFAKVLGFTYGLDPSFPMLKRARSKGLWVVCGRGENLPFKKESFAACGLFFTLCFVEDPLQVFQEAGRILKPQGKLWLGFIPADSSWARYYEAKKRAGHKLYRFARFYHHDEVLKLVREVGFSLEKEVSSLYQSPDESPRYEDPRDGYQKGAGFVALSLKKALR